MHLSSGVLGPVRTWSSWTSTNFVAWCEHCCDLTRAATLKPRSVLYATLMMSETHLQLRKSTLGLELVLVPTEGSGARPGASSRPQPPPCYRAASRLQRHGWVGLRRCQVTRFKLLLVPKGTEVWAYSLLRFHHTFRFEPDFLLYTLYISLPAAGESKSINTTPCWWHLGNIRDSRKCRSTTNRPGWVSCFHPEKAVRDLDSITQNTSRSYTDFCQNLMFYYVTDACGSSRAALLCFITPTLCVCVTV